MSMKIQAFCVLFLTLAVLLSGCGDPNRKKIVGEWEVVTPARVANRLKDSESNSTSNDGSRMRIDFRSNGTLSTQTSMGSVDSLKEGRWELLSFDEARSQLRLKCTLGLQESQHDVELVGLDKIKLVPPNMAGTDLKLTFKRISR